MLLLTQRFTELHLELGDLISESVAAPVSFPLGDYAAKFLCYLVATFTCMSFTTNT